MVRQFLKDSIVYGSASVLARAISLFLVPLYTRALTPADYGMVDILTIFGSLVNLTIALEISQAVARYFTDADNPSEKTAYASTSLWFTLGAYTLFVMVASLFATELSVRLLESPAHRDILRVAVLAIFGSGLFYLVQQQLRWDLQPRHFSAASLTFTLGSLGMSALFVLVFRLGVIGVFYGQLLGGGLGLVLGLYFARNNYRLTFDWGKCKEMLRFSMPLVPSSVGVLVTASIDRIAIKELMTLTDVGLFGIGYRLASSIGLVVFGFQAALTPLIYTHYRRPDTPGELARIFRYYSLVALLICLGLAMLAPEILRVFTTPDYYAATVVVPLLAPAITLAGMNVFTPGLAIAKKTTWIAVVNIVGAVLNAILNFALVPLWGIQGASLATFISAAAIFIMYMIVSQRLYFVPHAWSRLGLGVVVCVVVFLIGAQVHTTLWLGIAIKVGFMSVAALLLIRIGLIEPAEIRRAWQRARTRWISIRA